MVRRWAAGAERVDAMPEAGEGGSDFDYTDAFELRIDHPDNGDAITWLRAGLEGSPAVLRWVILRVHRHVLRFRLADRTAPDQVLGWRISKLDPGEARLVARGPLMSGLLVGRRRDSDVVRLDTYVTFHRRRAAPVIWAVVGPVHRTVAPLLLKRAAKDRAALSE